MVRLTEQLGGRADTVLGLAGAGDCFVTCLGGRNGRFGRLLGAGQTPEQARKAIGSTVEGITNSAAAVGPGRSVNRSTCRSPERSRRHWPTSSSTPMGAAIITRLLVQGLAGSSTVLAR